MTTATMAAVAAMALSVTAAAQIAAPNAAGVAMGHLHYRVSDAGVNRDFWVRLGGTARASAVGEVIEFPGLVILLTPGAASDGTEGSVVNHVAFRVASIAAIEARGIEVEYLEGFAGIASVFTPDGERIELFEEGTATNIGFNVAPGFSDASAERHNRALTAPIVTHHVHFYLPEELVASARDWYVTVFGATPGQRWRYLAADLPGMNLNFSAADVPQAPTRGRRLDHIGFEVAGLEAFCRELEARGIAFDVPYTRLPAGPAVALLTDPFGTTIELTEGLGTP